MKKLPISDPTIQSSLKFCEQILKTEPYNIDMILLRGVVYLTCDEPKKALSDFNLGVSLVPDNHMPYYLRSKAFYELEEFDYAIQDYLRALKYTNPPNQEHIDAYPEEVIQKKIATRSNVKDLAGITDGEVKQFLMICSSLYPESIEIKKFLAFHFNSNVYK
jgi:tetratricopeptide (TPR) repeat protein